MQGEDCMVRLNIGGGGVPIEGFTDIDRKSGNEAYPLKYDDNSVDEIRASHVLEHFSHRLTSTVIKEWVRVLKPGGMLRIAVPDFDKIIEYYNSDSDKYPIEGYLMGGHTNKDDQHGAIFNSEKLYTLMTEAGLGNIKTWTSELKDCAALPVSLNLAGTKQSIAPCKPLPDRVESVVAIMSMPRITFTDNMFSALEVTKLGIPIQRQSGVFWGQCMTRLFELNYNKYEYILTIDYDTVYKKEDILGLYALMQDNPNVDAICAMQMKRASTAPLMFIKDEFGEVKSEILASEFDKDLMPITSGHFGLTLIRSSSLKKIAKPWFMPVPDKDGSWGDGRTDEDVSFWLKFRDAGLTLCNANRIIVGHHQSMITWPGKDLTPIHQFPNEYQERGCPDEVKR